MLIDQPVDQRTALTVIGAGNCNDLDLKALSAVYSTIHLVDLDSQAMNDGVVAQGLEVGRGPLSLHGGIDVTGIADRINGWSPTNPPNDI